MNQQQPTPTDWTIDEMQGGFSTLRNENGRTIFDIAYSGKDGESVEWAEAAASTKRDR